MEHIKNSNQYHKFICEKCVFFSNNKKDYKRHLNTIKHNEVSKQLYKCKRCNENFKSKTSLWRHNKNCCIYTENDVKHLKDTIDGLKNTIDGLENKVGELQEDKIAGLERDKMWLLERENSILEQNKILIEQFSNNATYINSNNVNSNNQTFNLHFFLTNTCKDAMNISDFIDSIEVSVEDLKYLGKNGYVEGISKLIIDKLEEIDVTLRPLHCSDLKREIIHIKDKDVWEKDTKESKRIQKVLLDVKRSNSIALEGKYKEKYPQCMTDYNSKEHKEHGEIAYQNFGGKTKNILAQDNKIIKRVLKWVEIDKSMIKSNS